MNHSASSSSRNPIGKRGVRLALPYRVAAKREPPRSRRIAHVPLGEEVPDGRGVAVLDMVQQDSGRPVMPGPKAVHVEQAEQKVAGNFRAGLGKLVL